ncbi:nucleotide exchange factor GrpE [Buchnera aphidicola]|uniref:nucleotide exchange factor GrpE n=1 Tax=Buchnera aphidicola TaxID=9 RepID=UPI0031B6C6C4
MIQKEKTIKDIKKNDKSKILLKEEKKNLLTEEECQTKIQDLKNNLKNLKLRYYATLENIKKNTKKEISIIKNTIFKNFFKKLNPILQNIIEFLDYAKEKKKTKNPIIKGIYLTQKSFQKNLKIWKIELINQSNVSYNENIHQILDQSILQNPKKNKKNLIKILKNGYIIKKEIIQKAIVKIIE